MPAKQLEEALLVEDEEVVANLLRRVLGDYVRLTWVDSCEKGLELLRESPGRFAVILQDMAFPRDQMQGHEALEEIRREWPEQQVIILSIYKPEEMEEYGLHFPDIEHVPKGKEMIALLPALVVAAVCRMKARRDTWRPRVPAASSLRSPEIDESLADEDPGAPLHQAPEEVLPSEAETSPEQPYPEMLDAVKRARVLRVLGETGGNMKAASARLGIHYSRMRRLVRRFQIELPPLRHK